MKLLRKNKAEKPKENKVYTSLENVVDKTRTFNIFYSGVEQETYFEILYSEGIRNFLMSYHYLQNKKISMSKTYKDKGIKFFIDSGAHTYQQDPKYSEYTVEFWEEHLKNYLKWAEKNREYIFAIANFDFENVVGAEVVNEWNRKYFEPFMLRTGIPVCFVWHQNSYYDWEFYCKRYPYVGFSSVNIESNEDISISEYREKLKIAEKHDSLVHGFGMTRTSMLTELPFYTTDSTTWLVGLKYGEINYWTGNKMTRLKKDVWKDSTHIQNISSKYRLDKEKLKNEDTEEMIKANIGAFIDAEKFIQERLKSQMYWLKAKITKRDVDNLPSDFFPSAEWFYDTTHEGLKEYCLKCNINPDYEGAFNILYDVTAFVTWGDEEHKKMHDWYSEEKQADLIDELHDFYINRIVGSKEEKIQDLIAFFRSCVSGDNDKLLHLGTNFDRTVKERESYIEEDDTELVDISPEEVRERLKNLLPDKSFEEDGAPEVDALEEEIYRKADIIPTFDEKGKFVKGQVAVHRPKKVYSKKFPKLSCDTCYAAAKCPEFKAGYVCAYNKMFDRFSTRDMSDIIQSVQGMVEYNMTRMQKAMIMETLNGTIDPTVTGLMDTNIRYMQMLKQMYETGSPEVLKQTKVVRADGSEETTTSITNPQSGGIMEKLFGKLMNKEEEPKEIEEVVEATPKE